MYNNLAIFKTADAMSRHAGVRQAVTARNIANADTPGFKAQTVTPFAQSYEAGLLTTPRQTRAGHLQSNQLDRLIQTSDATSEASPNGNTVSLEEEMLNAVNVQREHDQALAIYKHALTVLRSSLGR